MANDKNLGQGGNGPRKAMTNIIPFITVQQNNCMVNRNNLINAAKKSGAFGDIPFEEPSWDVTEAYAARKKGAKANRKNDYIHFTQHKRKGQKGRLGLPFDEPFTSPIKALVRFRHEADSQNPNSHMIFIRAARYLYDALLPKGYCIEDASIYDFDAAAKAAAKQESEPSYYKLVGHLEELADRLDAYGLTKVRLNYRCKVKQRPDSLNTTRIQDADKAEPDTDRLPPEAALKALGQLYYGANAIPKGLPPGDPRSADRIMLLICTILLCTGLRMGEVLTLRAAKVKSARDGSKFIEYYREKASAGDTDVHVAQKTLLTETADLVEDCVNELLEATKEQRRVAKHIFEHRSVPVRLPEGKDVLTTKDMYAVLGMDANLNQFLKNRHIPAVIEKLSDPDKPNARRHTVVKAEDFLVGLLADHYDKPIYPGNDEHRIELHEGLCVAFVDQFSTSRQTLTYAVVPIHQGNVQDFLQGRASTKTWANKDGTVKRGESAVSNVFEKYGVTDGNGKPLGMRSHGFRHQLNHLLDEGGAPDMIQSIWFGRKNAKDTRRYQHMLPAQRVAQLIREIMNGKVKGHVAEKRKYYPIEKQEAFLKARIHSANDVGPGICIHDFQMAPCEHSLECSGRCDDYLWFEGDEEKKEDVLRRAAFHHVALQKARKEAADGTLGADSHLAFQEAHMKTLLAQLDALGLGGTDLDEVARQYAEGKRGGTNEGSGEQG